MRLSAKDVTILLAHGLIGWGMCGAIVAIGRKTIGLETTLIVHAAAVPVVFGTLTWFYYRRFGKTRPSATATVFLSLTLALDAGVVAPFAEKGYAMFASLLGTWIPFALIFVSTLLTGVIMRKRTFTP